MKTILRMRIHIIIFVCFAFEGAINETDLAIFTPIQYVLKVASLFMLLIFGWKMIMAFTKGGEDAKPMKAIRSNIGYLIAAILVWDIGIFLSLLGIVKTAATALASSITSLVSGVK